MRNYLLFFFLLFSCYGQGYAQISQKYFGRSGQSEYLTRSTILTGGNRVAVGYSYPNGTSSVGSEAFIMCIDPTDNFVWAKELATSGTDRFINVAATSDGGCVAVGMANGSGGGASYPSALIVRFSSTGAVLWSHIYKNTPEGEYFYGVAEMPNGHIVASGASACQPASDMSLVVDFDASGSVLWAKTYDSPGSDNAFALVAKGSDILVVGFFQSATWYDGYVMELNEANGNIKWIHSYDYTSLINGNQGQWPREMRLVNNTIYTDNYDFDRFSATSYLHSVVSLDTAGNNPVCLEYQFPGNNLDNGMYSLTGPSGELYLVQYPVATTSLGYDWQTGAGTANFGDEVITKVHGMNASAPGNWMWSRKLSNTGNHSWRPFQLLGSKMIGYGGTLGDAANAIGTQDALKVEADTSFPISASTCAMNFGTPTFSNPTVTLNTSFSFNAITAVTMQVPSTSLTTTAVTLNTTTPCAPSEVIINQYAAVLGKGGCDNTFVVDDANGFYAGDTILMIQMKGASIDSSNSATFGDVTAYNGAGNYELNVVSAVSGNNISLAYQVQRSYDIPGGKVQFVRIPSYPNYTLSQKHTCLAWNGTKGGVFAVRVSGTMTMNADIDVSGKGFFGARAYIGQRAVEYCVTDYYMPPNRDSSARKGEGITTISTSKSYGRGKLAIGGGGGNAHNGGGGGGSNAGGGGLGGDAFWGCNGNSLTPPAINNWGGIGGLTLATYNTSTNKVFMGGGGGAGHANNMSNADGGNGGGIVLVMAGTIASPASKRIIASGDPGTSCVAGAGISPCNDGMGGGGGGGAVLIKAGGFTGNCPVISKGGKGADVVISTNAGPWDIYGPGGGGGGGAIWVNGSTIPSNVAASVAGGANGVNVSQGNGPWGAAPGNPGTAIAGFNIPLPTILFTSSGASITFTDSIVNCFTRKFIPTATVAAGIASYRWDFGTGATSTQQSPVYTFPGAGTYKVTLTITDNNGCVFTGFRNIIIPPGVKADFTFYPYVPEANKPVQFTNKSTLATHYAWNFSDGTTSTDVDPLHLFRKSGVLHVCLTAYNDAGCSDSVCKDVPADVKIAIGVPSAFTPNDDGTNDLLLVKGAGIQQLHLVIFNRWGQKVFETNDQDKGWDGTYNGKPQEIDIYAYVLTATFFDGTSITKKGNINLLR